MKQRKISHLNTCFNIKTTKNVNEVIFLYIYEILLALNTFTFTKYLVFIKGNRKNNKIFRQLNTKTNKISLKEDCD